MPWTIWAIPGFLGQPSDWDILQRSDIIGVDLHAFSWNSLGGWAKQFNDWIVLQNKKPSVLMGYSLGGRFALHALVDRPEQWQAAIIVSAHSGFANDQERDKRKQQDQKWAERFEKEEWATLMQAWNAQEVFMQDDFHFDRQERDYQRQQLMNIFIHGSLAQQADLRSHIALLPIPILWITGSRDIRYSQLAQALSFAHPLSRWQKVEQAGHRVPWSQPLIFSQLIQAFLAQIQSGEARSQ
jgi:2-succinyl-6-hydroxy-2,4-cyclohexadiene-1-carboxylate synthase